MSLKSAHPSVHHHQTADADGDASALVQAVGAPTDTRASNDPVHVEKAGVSTARATSEAFPVAHQAAAATQTPATVSLSGTVFTDSNDDGLVDGTDKGEAGVTVDLISNGTVVATTTTASNGTYSFTGEAPGTYSVHVVLPTTPPGAVFSPPGSNTPPQPTGGTTTTATNLLTNGSFESSSFTTAAGYAGWSASANTAATPYGTGPGNGPEIALTNGTNAIAIDPTGATNPYAGAVAADNADPSYAGGSGDQAAFFVDDDAIQTLSQTVMLTGGQVYEIGFDLNETKPGASNPGYFQLQASIGGTVITTAGSTSGTKLTAGSWTHFDDLYTPTTTGKYTLTFTYSSGVPDSTLQSKDVLVDDVYIFTGQTSTTLTTTSEVNANGDTAPVTLTAGQSVGDESAGIYLPPATINGTVFTDTNGNGARDAGDAAIAGQTVNLTSAGTIVATTVTAADGTYSFTDLAAGTYTVTVTSPSGDAFSGPGASTTLTDSTVGSGGTQKVTVINGGTATVNAGLYKPVSLSGTIFTDTNADGAQQAADAGLAGQTVELIADGKVVGTTTSSATGTYSFSGEAPGTYSVQVIAAAGDHFSPNGTSTTLPDSAVSSTGASASLVLNSGASAIVDAGEYAPASVTGTVFTDANGDGAQQSSDAGFGGQTVELLSGTTVVATTTTAANGSYSFTGETPGAYSIKVLAAAGDAFSPAGTSATLPDSAVSAAGASAAFTLTSGSTTTVNAGEYAPAHVSGTVFTDANGDGAQQATDAGLAGQTVELLSGTTVVATTTTVANGAYSFAGVSPGTYAVQVVAAAGDRFSPAGTSTTLPDSAVSASGASAAFTLVSGSATTVDAGEYAPVSLSGTVFTDANADGAEEATDAGLAGQTVKLISGNTVVATTTTAANGSYSFAGEAPGAYSVQVVAAPGASFSPTGISATLPDSTVSSTGASFAVTLASGQSSTVNAGEYIPGTIAGTVFNDQNGDGVKQAGDAGLSGLTVTLTNAGGTVLATTTTAANGSYSFAGVVPGTDTVHVTAPAGDIFSAPGASTTLPDSTVATNGSQSVTVTSGSASTVNAGVYAPGTISGLAFLDGNATGTYHVGDPGIAGVTVQLLTASGAPTGLTTTTNAAGEYGFAGLSVGSYEVKVLAPAGLSYSAVEHASGNPLLDSDVDPTSGISGAIVVTPGATVAQGNAGFTLNGNFTGTTPTNIGSGGVYTGNQGTGVIVGSGNDKVYTGSGGNNVVALGGTNNLVEAGSGAVNDIVTSAGALNAQTQNDANGYLFAGVGSSLLQGGTGNTYLIGGVGTNQVFAGQGNNVLAAGIGGGSVSQTGGTVTGYSGGTYAVLSGKSDTVLYQKGDGVLIINNGFNASTDNLQIYGYSGGTVQQVNGQTVLYLGGNDLIVFNGPNTLSSSLAGVSFNSNIAAAPQYGLSFGANGLPQIAPVSGVAMARPAFAPSASKSAFAGVDTGPFAALAASWATDTSPLSMVAASAMSGAATDLIGLPMAATVPPHSDPLPAAFGLFTAHAESAVAPIELHHLL